MFVAENLHRSTLKSSRVSTEESSLGLEETSEVTLASFLLCTAFSSDFLNARILKISFLHSLSLQSNFCTLL